MNIKSSQNNVMVGHEYMKYKFSKNKSMKNVMVGLENQVILKNEQFKYIKSIV